MLAPDLFQQSPQLIAIDESRQSADCKQAQRYSIKFPILCMNHTHRLVFETKTHSQNQSVQQSPLDQS